MMNHIVMIKTYPWHPCIDLKGVVECVLIIFGNSVKTKIYLIPRFLGLKLRCFLELLVKWMNYGCVSQVSCYYHTNETSYLRAMILAICCPMIM